MNPDSETEIPSLEAKVDLLSELQQETLSLMTELKQNQLELEKRFEQIAR
jgi:hypothetical protein